MQVLAIVLLVFLAAFAMRAGLYSAGLGFEHADERDYVRIAKSIAAGSGFSGGPDADWPDEFRAPLLPYLVGGLHALGLPLSGVRWVLGLVNSMYPVALLLIAWQLSRRGAWALIAAAWGVVHPFQARGSFELTTDALAATTVAFAGLALLCDRWSDSPFWYRAACGGLLAAAACLRSNLLLVAVPVFILWAWQAWSGRSRRERLRFLTGLAAWAVLIAPFVAVRSAQEGRVLLLTDAGSEIVWRGNSEYSADYLAGTRSPQQYVEDYRAMVGEAWGSPGAASRSLEAVQRFVRARPGDWFRLKARMLFETWRPWPSFQEEPGVLRLGPAARAGVRLAKLGWYLLTIALLAGSILRGTRLGRHEPLALVPLAWIAIATLFGVALSPDPRYRLPYDVALVMLNVPWILAREGRANRFPGERADD